MADLILPLKREYFEAIARGDKTEEYRLYNEFWRRRIEGRNFSNVILTLGYPKSDDHTRRLAFPWRGYILKTITHPHFDNRPTKVFAIRIGASEDSSQ